MSVDFMTDPQSAALKFIARIGIALDPRRSSVKKGTDFANLWFAQNITFVLVRVIS
jgi:hypothetical protein